MNFIPYSRVPNKRGGERIIGGLEMVRYNTYLYIFMWKVILLIHLLMNFGSVECTS